MTERRLRQLSALPKSWRWTTVGEITDVVRGASPRPKGDPRYFGGHIPWIMIADVTRQPGKYLFGTRQGVTTAGAELSRKIPAGELILSNSATVCVPKILKVDGCIHDGFVAFPTLKDRVSLDFAYYWFECVRQTVVQENRQGVTQVNLNTGIVREIHFPLAPLIEQRQIVGEIEKQFTRLEAGVAALRRVQANLKRYRGAVLKAACEGRLVPTEADLARKEGRAYEIGEQLLGRILVERRQKWTGRRKYKEPTAPETADLPLPPKGWVWATWDQIGFSQNGRPFPSAKYGAVGFKLLRPGNLHVSGKVLWTDDNTRRMPQRFADENPDLIVRGSELVMNLTAQSLKDEFLGRVCLTSDHEQCLLNQRLARLTPVLVLPKYVLFILRSWRFRRFVDGLNSGSLIQHMFTSQLAEFRLLLPPVVEQARIVAEVERRLSVIEELESVVSASFQRAVRLRQSILERAFSGRLVAADGASQAAADDGINRDAAAQVPGGQS
jgi:type I restriction enzyme S subunit